MIEEKFIIVKLAESMKMIFDIQTQEICGENKVKLEAKCEQNGIS
jgi:hypothetical protein